jgi:hypothetical protein
MNKFRQTASLLDKERTKSKHRVVREENWLEYVIGVNINVKLSLCLTN